ncbi:MAG: ABC transporter permease [Rubricoccaceae bacterium]
MLARSSRRYLLRHPWLTALSVLGVAVGVAVVVAVDLANASATRAFQLSGEAVTGRATHQVVGGPGGLEAGLYRRLRVDLGVREAAPVADGFVRPEADSARVLQVLGVDLFAEDAFRPYVGSGDGFDLAAFLTTPGAALLSDETRRALGLAEGDTLALRADGRAVAARVAGTITPEDARSRSALQNLLVVDLATAQEWLGLTGTPGASDSLGRLSRIDLILPEGTEGEALRARIEAALPPEAALRKAGEQAAALETMTAAFRLNLTALSLLALVVGVFLIYNTVTFSVVQRRRLIGTFRALGVTRGEVFRLVLLEALAVGAVGAMLGVVLGLALGSGLTRLVTQTIGDLYFVVRVREFTPDPAALAKGVALGLAATLAAAVLPAREATTAPPASALRRSSEEAGLARGAGRLALGGLACGAAGLAMLRLPGGIGPAYGGLLLVLLGFALAAPWLTRQYVRGMAPLAGRLFGPVGRMAARGITASLSRTAVAVAALAVAVAATVGVGTMITSFRTTVVEWLGSALRADVYISPPSLVFRRGGGVIDPALAADLAALPGVAGVDALRARTLETERGAIDLGAADLAGVRAAIYRYQQGTPEEAAAAARAGAVLVSEPFARRFGVTRGDSVTLPTDRGPRAFRVGGVYYEYGSDLGTALLDDAVFDRYFRDPGLSGLALTAAPGQDVDALVAAAQATAAGRQQLQIRSNRALREASIELFDQTFLVTSVLRLLAVVVAFVGVLSALMALQLERRRELAVLRAQGLTPAELRRMVLVQTGLMGLWAGALAVPLGLAMAAVLVFVVNVRAFGWTLAFVAEPSVLAQALALALAAAVLAGLYPAWQMARTDPALALREE